MHEIESDRLFSSLIKINYDKRFIRIAQDFIENLSGLAGANKKEILQISLLIEECLAFIMDKYIDCRVAAHIQILFSVTTDKKIRLEITDIGPPIHPSMIPSFDIADENSETGLWYKVAQGLSDSFDFINKFGAGWLIQVEKCIENVTFCASGVDGQGNDPHTKQAETIGEKHVRPATAADVPALIDLAYMTYRYTYIFPDFYDGELLKKYIEEKLYEIILIVHGSKVAGAFAIKYLDAGYVSAEIGAAMISPEYRSTDAIGLIVREVDHYVRTNPHRCEFFLSTAVTSHVRSQKSLAKVCNGFKPLMIALNMVPKPEFIGIEHKTGGRESGLYVYHLNQKLKMKKLHITGAKHLQIINELIACTGNGVEILTETSEPDKLASYMAVTRSDAAQFATITIESMGRDWFSVLSKKIFSAIASGMESVKVTIPTSSPLPADMEKMLTDLNLVFCGLSPRSLENMDLAYCLATRPVDFSQIKLYDPLAQKLLMHIEQNYGG